MPRSDDSCGIRRDKCGPLDMNRTFLHFAVFAAAAATAAIPEPSVVFYGHVMLSPPNTACVPATVAWSLNGNAETLTVIQTQVLVVNRETFYITRIPFETPKLAGRTPLSPYS